MASFRSDMDGTLASINQDMTEVKTTIREHSLIMSDIQEKVNKQGTIILGLQAEFKASMLDILSQVRLLTTHSIGPPTSMPGPSGVAIK